MSLNTAELAALCAQARHGVERCQTQERLGAISRVPDDRIAGKEIDMVDAQIRALGPEVLGKLNVELLRRALALLDFWHNNVGDTADYPIRIKAETAYDGSALAGKVQELHAAVGALTEV